MSKIKELKEKGFFFDKDWIQLFGKALPSLLAISIRHPLLVLNANKACPEGPENLGPEKLPYEIPEYTKDMKYCKSDKKYLRPTFLCNPRHPDIIAMAHKLGAYQKSDKEYAEAVYQFVNGKIRGDFSSLKSAVQTLHRGHGTCLDKLSLFVALCRAAGIPGRYKLYNNEGIEALYDIYMSADPLIKKWYDALGFFVLHGNGEIKIDGEWIPADVSADFYHAPTVNAPIPRLGDDPADLFTKPATENVLYREGLPWGLHIFGSLPFIMFKGTGRALNKSIQANYKKGKKLFEQIDDIEEYNKRIRKKYKPKYRDSGQKARKILNEIEPTPSKTPP